MRIGAGSRVLAVLGDPVAHSLSPAMHNAAIAVLGLEAVYVALRTPAARLPAVLPVLAELGIAGNLTVPLKVAAVACVDRATERARRVGAVNTFWVAEGLLHGDNTDVGGVLDALDALEAEGPWLLAGTGGAARAVAGAAAERGTALLVRSRDPRRAESFAAWARGLGVAARPDDGGTAATVINATPLGLDPADPLPVDPARLDGCAAALDLVYRPGATAWVRAARAAGLRAADGRRMLVAQGLLAFARFFPDAGAPPRAVMEAAVRRGLAG